MLTLPRALVIAAGFAALLAVPGSFSGDISQNDARQVEAHGADPDFDRLFAHFAVTWPAQARDLPPATFNTWPYRAVRINGRETLNGIRVIPLDHLADTDDERMLQSVRARRAAAMAK